MAHRFHIVDVFAEQRYAGNPLAVVRDAGDLDTARMQRIALEFGFSETTFVVSGPGAGEAGAGAGEADVRVRIFTPAEELPFAGHPTLGTAWVVRTKLASGRPAQVQLALGVGSVPVAFDGEGDAEVAWLEAPPVKLERRVAPTEIARALGLAASDVEADLPPQEVRAGVHQLIVPLASRKALERSRLDEAAFAPLAAQGLPSHVYLFTREAASPDVQLHARMFFTAGGVREDPATGSATACLGAYLLAHTGRDVSLRIAQGVEMGRPSLLRLEARTLPGGPQVRVGGRVIEVARGELL
jgi:trans-2,3-dihydro-3-hydroxyanthranilate isomerase